MNRNMSYQWNSEDQRLGITVTTDCLDVLAICFVDSDLERFRFVFLMQSVEEVPQTVARLIRELLGQVIVIAVEPFLYQ